MATEIFEAAVRAFDISHVRSLAIESIGFVSCEMTRPSVLYRPALFLDGNQFCSLYGSNLMDGCSGFGDTPELAMRDFDANWNKRFSSGDTRTIQDAVKPMEENERSN